MRLATRIPIRKGPAGTTGDFDPREKETAEIIDLASRNSFPAVTQRKNKSDAFGLAAGVGLVVAIGAVTLWSMNSARVAEPQGVGSPQPLQPQPAAQLAQPALQPATPALVPAPDPAPAPVLANAPAVNPAAITNPYGSPTVVFDASTSPVSVGDILPAAPTAVPGTGSASDFASRVGGVGGAPARATPMSNPQTTVTQGTLIPAILETAIETDVPGYVRAVVSQDVRSFDGTRVLVPRSSRLIGQYQSGLQGGQKRAYVIWTRLIRPDGASVNLASPAIGFDGTTGLEGKVNSHFFKRFGSAMLLSVIGGLSTVASGGTSVILGGGQSAASTALQQDGQISPTVRVRQGEPIRVFTARDLDFTQVTGG